jgi:hypothetical protein
MNQDPHRQARRAIAAHFSARSALGDGAAEEQAMRAHLPVCADCHAVYERHMLFARLTPAAASPEDRLARSLGFRPAPRGARAARFQLGVPALLGAAFAAALIVYAVPRRPFQGEGGGRGRVADGFVARGLADSEAGAGPELQAYRIEAGGPARPVDAVRAGDELAFAYRNPSGWRHLMVFAVDEHGHIYWYHPGWSRAEDNPSAVPIAAEPGVHELPAAVVQQFDGEQLVVHALFTNQELTVRHVEGAFAAAAREGRGRTPSFPDANDVTYPMRVVR